MSMGVLTTILRLCASVCLCGLTLPGCNFPFGCWSERCMVARQSTYCGKHTFIHTLVSIEILAIM